MSFLDSSKGQITISVQTFPDNKNRRVKWCYKTRNRTKLKIYQRKTSTNPFFSQGIVFDHRSADLKKKKKQKNKLVALSTTPSLVVHSEMSFTNVCAVFLPVDCNLFILYLPPFIVLPFQFGVSPFKTNILGCPSQFKYFFWLNKLKLQRKLKTPWKYNATSVKTMVILTRLELKWKVLKHRKFLPSNWKRSLCDAMRCNLPKKLQRSNFRLNGESRHLCKN